MQYLWTQDDANLLKKLRSHSEIPIEILAEIIGTTPEIIIELEEAGVSNFENLSIKYQTGRRLLQILGKDNNYQNFIIEQNSYLSSEKKIDTTNIQFINNNEFGLKDFKALIRNINVNIRAALSIVTIFFASLILYTIHQINNQPRDHNSDYRIIKEVKIAELSVDDQQKIKSINEDTQCKWRNISNPVTSFKPYKPGKYLHITTKKTVSLCIMDKTMNITRLTLKPNAYLNHIGSSPFRIYSSDLKEIKIYYQGYQVLTSDYDDITIYEVPL